MIVAMVNYYDEGPDLMSKMVGELAKMGVDKIVAAEGPYGLYPMSERIFNEAEERYALETACGYHNIPLYIASEPVWRGNEVEKRRRLLDMAIALNATWLLIWDADFILETPTDESANLQQWASSWTKNFGDCMIYHADAGNPPWRNRPFLRYVPGMRYVSNHHSILYPDSTLISTGMVSRRDALMQITTAIEDLGELLPNFLIRHDRRLRPTERLERQQKYYENRDRIGAES